MNNYLNNIVEDNWSDSFLLETVCPYCEIKNNMPIIITKKSIRIDCKNPGCCKVFFYRRVNLGSRE